MSGRWKHLLLALASLASIAVACAPAAPPAPTAPPAAATAAPAPTAAPAKPTTAPAAAPTAGGVGAPAAPTSAQAAATPKRGGTLVVAASADPGQFNPAISTAGGTHFVADNIYNGLLFYDQNLEPKPDLADSWTVSPDGKTYTFKLHPGVKWQDGQPFSSEDVKFTFEQVLLKYHARTKAGLEGVLDGVDTPDPNTVVFRFKQPYGSLLQRLDVVEAPIVAKHVYEGTDPTKADANLKPVGTGPFKLAEYVKGDHVRLVRNESYFKPGLPYLDEVVFRIIPQASTTTLALEQGEVDFMNGVPGPDLSRVTANPGLVTAKSGAGSGGSFCVDTAFFNLARPPLDKREVRQAISYAINRQQMLDQIYFGQGKVATAAISSSVAWAYNPDAPKYPYDPAKANQLLDQAGLPKGPDGTRFKMQFVHSTQYAKQGEMMRQQLSQIGVDLELVPMEVNAANERNYIQKDFDLGFASYCNGPDPEIGVRRMYTSSNIGPVLFSNGAQYRNPQVDQLFDQAAAATSRDERGKLYHQIQDIVGQDQPYLSLIETESTRAWRKPYHDFFYWSGNLAEAAWTEGK